MFLPLNKESFLRFLNLYNNDKSLNVSGIVNRKLVIAFSSGILMISFLTDNHDELLTAPLSSHQIRLSAVNAGLISQYIISILSKLANI
jgi:hypothetical protein